MTARAGLARPWAAAIGLVATVALCSCTALFDAEPLVITDAAADGGPGDAPAGADLPGPGGDAEPDVVTPNARIALPGDGVCVLHYQEDGLSCPSTACGGVDGWKLTFDASASEGLVGEQASWEFKAVGADFVVEPTAAVGLRPTATVRFANRGLGCLTGSQAFQMTLTVKLTINGGADADLEEVTVSGVRSQTCTQSKCEPP